MQNNHQSHEEEEEKELTFKQGEESESEMLEQLILED